MKTTIQIDGETLKKLKTIKIAKRESYDEIINRMMDIYNEYGNKKRI